MYLASFTAFLIAALLPFAAATDVDEEAPQTFDALPDGQAASDRVVTPTYDDCAEIYGVLFWYGVIEDNVHNIKPETSTDPFPVYCDMTTADGGWTVIQRRFNGSLNFDRRWGDYENGFGDVDGEYWLGLRNIYKIVSQASYELYIEVEDWDDSKAYARYSTFSLGDDSDNYRLTIAGYSGDASDCMVQHHDLNGMQFSTRDRDNDMHSEHCAQWYSGGWWYNRCSHSSLNGPYYKPKYYKGADTGRGVMWAYWGGHRGYHSLKATKMMVRPTNFKRRFLTNK